MRKLISLLAATALAVSGVAAPAAGAIGQACDEGLYSDTWLCATITVPDTVTLSTTDRVLLDITVDYTASGAFELDTNNWIRVTSQATGVVWTFDLYPISSTRDMTTLSLAPELATGRYTIDLYSSADVYYGWDVFDYEWLYITQSNVAYFTVEAPPVTPPPPKKKAQKTTMKLSAAKKTVGYNKKVTLKGSVVYGSSKKPLKNKKLRVFFDPTGERPKKKVGTVKTNSKGKFSTKFRQKVPGRWTVEWKGSSSYKKSSKSVTTRVKAKKYKSCKALNKDYPGGVARTERTAWKGAGNREPVVFKALYKKNSKLDRDTDGVVCER